MKVFEFKDGYLLNADSTATEIIDFIREISSNNKLIYTDPPYSSIIKEKWDNQWKNQKAFADWLIEFVKLYQPLLIKGGSFYVWGGIGKNKDRPFFEFLSRVESETNFVLKNFITWSKRRAYGKSHDYLFTREELAWLINDSEKPEVFNIPLLDKKRGYEGYNPAYPAKSEYLRRTNVWNDINELFKRKIHPTEKPVKLAEVVIQTHTNKNDWVLDPFAGSGSTAIACRNLGRKFVLVERDEGYCEKIKERLG